MRQGSCQTHHRSTLWALCELITLCDGEVSLAVCWRGARLIQISECGGFFYSRQNSDTSGCLPCMHAWMQTSAVHEVRSTRMTCRCKKTSNQLRPLKTLIASLLLELDWKLRNVLSVLHSWWVVCWSHSNTAALILRSTSVELVVGHIDVVELAEICIDNISLELGCQELPSVSSCVSSTSDTGSWWFLAKLSISIFI